MDSVGLYICQANSPRLRLRKRCLKTNNGEGRNAREKKRRNVERGMEEMNKDKADEKQKI